MPHMFPSKQYAMFVWLFACLACNGGDFLGKSSASDKNVRNSSGDADPTAQSQPGSDDQGSNDSTKADAGSEGNKPVALEGSDEHQCIWPPNKKMVNVTFDHLAADCTISAVRPTQEIQGELFKISDDKKSVQLKAHREGAVGPQIYQIDLTCQDEPYLAIVPHDMGHDVEHEGKSYSCKKKGAKPAKGEKDDDDDEDKEE